MRLLALVTITLLAMASTPAGPANAVVVYTESFEGVAVGATPGPEWSTSLAGGVEVDRTPGKVGGHAADRFLGHNDTSTTLGLTNEIVTLSLSGLPAHSDVSLSLELFIIQSWDRNNLTFGPDRIAIAVGGGPTLLDTTFQLGIFGGSQCYPANCPASNAAGTLAGLQLLRRQHVPAEPLAARELHLRAHRWELGDHLPGIGASGYRRRELGAR